MNVQGGAPALRSAPLGRTPRGPTPLGPTLGVLSLLLLPGCGQPPGPGRQPQQMPEDMVVADALAGPGFGQPAPASPGAPGATGGAAQAVASASPTPTPMPLEGLDIEHAVAVALGERAPAGSESASEELGALIPAIEDLTGIESSPSMDLVMQDAMARAEARDRQEQAALDALPADAWSEEQLAQRLEAVQASMSGHVGAITVRTAELGRYVVQLVERRPELARQGWLTWAEALLLQHERMSTLGDAPVTGIEVWLSQRPASLLNGARFLMRAEQGAPSPDPLAPRITAARARLDEFVAEVPDDQRAWVDQQLGLASQIEELSYTMQDRP